MLSAYKESSEWEGWLSPGGTGVTADLAGQREEQWHAVPLGIATDGDGWGDSVGRGGSRDRCDPSQSPPIGALEAMRCHHAVTAVAPSPQPGALGRSSNLHIPRRRIQSAN